MAGVTNQGLSAGHEEAWRHFLRAHALLVRLLDGELRAEHQMTLATYDALVQLSEAPGRWLYMKQLADALNYSASGATGLVAGLERKGYAVRAPDPESRRAVRVSLTDEGLRALEEAWPTHVAGVEKVFAAHVTDGQARTLARVFSAIRRDLEG